jgi:hypothetical protein
MRSAASVLAAALAAVAALVSAVDHAEYFVPFYVGLMVLGVLNAWVVRRPHASVERWIATGTAGLWVLAAAWAAALLIMSVTIMQASSPPPTPENPYAGLTPTTYRVAALFGGAILLLTATFAPGGVNARGGESRPAS